MPPIHTDEKITLKKNVKLDEINLGSEDILGSIKLPFQHHSAFINICFSISPLILYIILHILNIYSQDFQ